MRLACLGGCWLVLVGAFVSAQEKREVVVQSNLVYSQPGGVDLHLDLARPAKSDGPLPTVVCLHGGAWQIGHRAMHARTMRLLAEHGYAAATITYRLAPTYKFPAQVEDGKCAVRFLRSRAKEYNLDPERFAVLGDSAGAHLSLLIGLMRREDGCEGQGCLECSSQVKAVVNFFGPTDFPSFKVSEAGEVAFRLAKKTSNDILIDFLGTADRDAAILKKASPVSYIRKDSPAVLTLHGTYDILVPVQQARLLHERLKSASVPEQMVIFEGAGHGWSGPLRDKSDRIVLDFLERQLRGK